METKEYPNLKEALQAIMLKDREYDYVLHCLDPGEIIERHTHPVDEYLIFDYGKFVLRLNSREYKIYHTSGINVLPIPKNTRHGIRTLSAIEYFVLRERLNVKK